MGSCPPHWRAGVHRATDNSSRPTPPSSIFAIPAIIRSFSAGGSIAAERRIILFSGRVQGVGFRMTAVQFARDLPLAGTVRNLDTGAVELDIEGPAAAIDDLVSRLREHFERFIRTTNETPAKVQGLAKGIRITH